MDTCNKGFNYSVLGELRACQEGLHKGQRGLLPSSYPVRQIAARVEREAAKYMELVPDDTGAIWVFEPKKAVSWFLVHFGYHELGATADTRVLVALTGDGLRLTSANEGMFCGGLKHVDPRLKSQQMGANKLWHQSKNEYFPQVISFSSEKDALPFMKALDKELLRIEQEGTLDPGVAAEAGLADASIFIKVVKPADMKFTQTETKRGGACKNKPFFCHMCCCNSQQPTAGQPTTTCPIPELQCTGTCRHWKITTAEEVRSMQAAADELQQELGKPYLRAYPCCSCADDYKAIS
jgi:hypothetical protein